MARHGTVYEILTLAELASEIGPVFEVRRLYGRIGAGEITIAEAVNKLFNRSQQAGQVGHSHRLELYTWLDKK